MKKIILLAIAIISFALNINAFELKEGEKAAILMVHFGTTFDDTRSATIDAINAKVRERFPDMQVCEAYTSRIIIKRLKQRGVEKSTPREMLLRLAADGYTHVFVQSTNVIDGVEAEALRNEVELMQPFFKDIRVGYPLLYSIEDCRNVEKILAERYAGNVGKRSGVVLVGHGTSTPANAIYSQMDYMFAAEGNPAIMVTTIEGYPTLDTTIANLGKSRISEVTLVPFMFVAGDHARNDIAGDFREELEKAGFKVNVVVEGLGQIPAIQDLYVSHIEEGLKERPVRAAERKAAFIRENQD